MIMTDNAITPANNLGLKNKENRTLAKCSLKENKRTSK